MCETTGTFSPSSIAHSGWWSGWVGDTTPLGMSVATITARHPSSIARHWRLRSCEPNSPRAPSRRQAAAGRRHRTPPSRGSSTAAPPYRSSRSRPANWVAARVGTRTASQRIRAGRARTTVPSRRRRRRHPNPSNATAARDRRRCGGHSPGSTSAASSTAGGQRYRATESERPRRHRRWRCRRSVPASQPGSSITWLSASKTTRSPTYVHATRWFLRLVHVCEMARGLTDTYADWAALPRLGPPARAEVVTFTATPGGHRRRGVAIDVAMGRPSRRRTRRC